MQTKFITSLFVLCFLVLAGSLHAQKLDGKWKRIARKGNDPCAVDMQMIFAPGGGAVTVLHGAQYEGCRQQQETFSAWKVEKKQLGNKKGKVIALTLDSETIYMALLEFDGEFMKVRAEVVDDDTTRAKDLIFRRIE